MVTFITKIIKCTNIVVWNGFVYPEGINLSEIDDIIKKLNEQETVTKQCADIWSLGNFGSDADKATKQLIKILYSKENWRIRTWAAWSLGRIGGRKSRKALEKLIKSEEDDEIVYTEANNALEWLIRSQEEIKPVNLFELTE
ncbi:MAG: HEAT repeat domain-containing protein [Asgard group archaeon]|nr:HEAT repeat domain-containing protein [Asgard group archaeon]